MMKKFCRLFFLFAFLSAGAETLDTWNRWIGFPMLDGKWSYRSFTRGKIDIPGDATLRSAYLKNTVLCGLRANELKIRLDGDHIIGFEIVFGNKGDTLSRVKKQISADRRQLRDALISKCGQPETETGGAGRIKTKREVWRTDEVVFALESDHNEYTILHLFPPNGGAAAFDVRETRKDIRSEDFSRRVRRNDFGDVFIVVPQVDQGGKGYCVPATYERILRYYGVTSIGMHQLAALFDSDRDDGTSLVKAHKKIASLFRGVGLSAHAQGDIAMPAIKKAIDEGKPLLWCLFADPKYEDIRMRNTKERGGSPQEWRRNKIVKSKVPSKNPRETAHLCLVVGYNETTDEIAVSNSWASERDGTPSWVPFRVAKKYSQGVSFLYAP